jgi:small subunit ribosomal protein S8
MSVTDPIADMLTRLRNATARGHEKVDLPSSKMKTDIAQVLKREGYIKDFRVIKDETRDVLKVFLKYGPENKCAITTLRRKSRPGRRVYVGWDNIPPIMNGLGIAILSTPKGIITDREARKAKVGGELLCEVW